MGDKERLFVPLKHLLGEGRFQEWALGLRRAMKGLTLGFQGQPCRLGRDQCRQGSQESD